MKLHETYIAFHKPSIVIEAFKDSGIYFVRRSAISNDKLKPYHTFTDAEKVHDIGVSTFQLYSDTKGTPSIQRYDRRLEEGWDIEVLSLGFTETQRISPYLNLPFQSEC